MKLPAGFYEPPNPPGRQVFMAVYPLIPGETEIGRLNGIEVLNPVWH